MSIRFIDAHLHLQDERILAQAELIIARAESAGVQRFFCNATRESDWQNIMGLARNHTGVVPFLGIHPRQADSTAAGWEARLAEALSCCSSGRAGIGETGLDKFASSGLQMQQKLFAAQLEIAADLFIPICIHCVRCWKMLLDTLERQAAGRGLPPVMIHSFSGSVETMHRLQQLGCLISYSLRMMNTQNAKLLNTFRQTPVEALLLETDAPDQLNAIPSRQPDFLTPHNEPLNVAALYRFGAEQRMMHLKDFANQLWNNATIYTNQTPAR